MATTKNKLIELGAPEAHEKLTGRFFWRKSGETGFNDAGNCKDYVDGTTRSLVTRARTKQGARFVNDEQADVCHENYTFLLDEHVPEQERLIKLAKIKPNQTQHAREGQTATIEEVNHGRWFSIGSFKIANVIASASVYGPLEEGTDFDVDAENGRIFIRPESEVMDGEDVNLFFDQPGIVFESLETQKETLFYCDVIIEEYNQYSPTFLRRMEFKAFINVTEFPSHTGEFSTYRAKVTAAEPVKVIKRPEASSLNVAPVSEEGPAHSSSSSSSQSSQSSNSSSSSTVASYTSSSKSYSSESRTSGEE